MEKLKIKAIVVSTMVMFMMLVTTSSVFAQDDQTTDEPKNPQEKVEQQDDQVQQEDQVKGQEDQNKYAKKAEALSNDLQTQLNLSEEQTAQVQTILISYQKDLTTMAQVDPNAKNPNMKQNNADNQDLVNQTNSRITALLNETQKAKWETVKSDWWKQVNDQISNKTSSTL